MAYGGKDFEDNFSVSWKKQVNNLSFVRLYDTTNGFKTVANPCDYLLGIKECELMLELKTTKSSSLSFSNITDNQFNQMLERSLYTKYTNGGILVYFREKHNLLMYYPIEHIAQIKLSGSKSINPVKHLNAGRSIKFNKKRVNIEVDCNDLLEAFSVFYGEGSEEYWGQEKDYLRQIYARKTLT